MAKFAIDFEGWIEVEAKDAEEAQNIFWQWAGDAEDVALVDYRKVILRTPCFEFDGSEEVEEV